MTQLPHRPHTILATQHAGSIRCKETSILITVPNVAISAVADLFQTQTVPASPLRQNCYWHIKRRFHLRPVSWECRRRIDGPIKMAKKSPVRRPWREQAPKGAARNPVLRPAPRQRRRNLIFKCPPWFTPFISALWIFHSRPGMALIIVIPRVFAQVTLNWVIRRR